MTTKRNLIRSQDVLWEELDGEAVLVSTRLNRAWHLNAVGTYIWKHMDGATSYEAIVNGLCRGKVELGRIKHDVMAFCAELEREGLLARSAQLTPQAACNTGSTCAFLGGIYDMPKWVKQHSAVRSSRPHPRGTSL